MTAARRLAAILAVDVIGYSRLMGEREAGTGQPNKSASRVATARVQVLARLICGPPSGNRVPSRLFIPRCRPERRSFPVFVLSLRMGQGQFNDMLRDRAAGRHARPRAGLGPE
jgi:hypothetical protein